MTDVINNFGEIFSECLNWWNYRFYIGRDLSFTLADVAEVAVVIFVVTLLIGALTDDGWGA